MCWTVSLDYGQLASILSGQVAGIVVATMPCLSLVVSRTGFQI